MVAAATAAAITAEEDERGVGGNDELRNFVGVDDGVLILVVVGTGTTAIDVSVVALLVPLHEVA